MHDSSIKAVLVVFGLLLVAAIGSSKALGESRNLGLKLLAKTSLFFLILGAVVGPQGLEFIDANVLQQLSPIVVIGLGWIGFLYGNHLEYRDLRKFRTPLFWTAFGEAMITFALVGGAFCLLSYFKVVNLDPIALVLLASTSACTAPVRRFLTRDSEDEATYKLAHFCSELDDLPGLIALGLLFSYSPPQVGPNIVLSIAFWFLVHLVIGVVFGWVTDFLYHGIESAEGQTDPGELTLVFFGMLCLSSGFAAYLDLSPLFVGVVSGVVFANISEHSDSLANGLAEREHTVFVLFLLVSGCYWPFRGFTAWLPLGVYIGMRLLGKVLGSLFSRKVFLSSQEFESASASDRFGLALIPQGGLAIAMVVSYLWSFSAVAAAWAINIVHISVIINDLLAPYLIKNLPRDEE